jgi:hypothetical protein
VEVLSDIQLPRNPDAALEAATKQYVDGAWVPFTPVVKLGAAVVTVTHSFGYRFANRAVQVQGVFKYQSGAASGDGVVRFQLPITPWLPTVGAVYVHPLGTGVCFTTAGAVFTFTPTFEGGADICFRPGNWPSSPAAMTYNNPGLIAVGDEYHLNLLYRCSDAALLLRDRVVDAVRDVEYA